MKALLIFVLVIAVIAILGMLLVAKFCPGVFDTWAGDDE